MARVFATKTEFSYFVLEQSLPKDDSVSTFGKESGKISAQPHTTLCIQFLTRENNKKQYISIGKTDLFYNSMGLCRNFTKKVTAVGNLDSLWITCRRAFSRPELMWCFMHFSECNDLSENYVNENSRVMCNKQLMT